MFQRLKEKWQVSWPRFILIFCTFATGGSLCGYAGRKLLALTSLGREDGLLYWVVYIVLITILWPFCVLLISIPLGQFLFFRNYLRKMGRRIAGKSSNTYEVREMRLKVDNSIDMKKLREEAEEKVVRIAIFASGAGSNAAKIIEHLKDHKDIKVALVVCNKPGAGVIGIAESNGIPVLMIEKEQFFRGDAYLPALREHGIGFIVLAGFLWKVPVALIRAYPNHIINIHPALLPKYGGKGMYGMKVHEAVIAAGEKQSGITIHYVNEHFDEGEHIFQAACDIEATDTPESLAGKIHALEHAHFPMQVEKLVLKR